MCTSACPTRIHVRDGKAVKIELADPAVNHCYSYMTGFSGSVEPEMKCKLVWGFSVPHQWPGEANINMLVDDSTLDPVSGFLPCKSQLCNVTRG